VRRSFPTVLFVVASLLTWLAPATSSAVEIVGVAGASPNDAVLIGAGGEIYKRTGTSWKRTGEGGTAATLAAARGITPTEIWGVGANVPTYRYDGRVWSVVKVGVSGTAVLARSGALALVVGKRVLLWTAGKWQLLPALPVASIAVWAAGPKDALVIGDNGELRRWNGSVWKVIPHGMPQGETPRRLFAGPAGQVYAVGDGGTLLRVERAVARKMSVGPLAPANARWLFGGVAQNKLWLVGDGLHEGKPRMIVAKVEGTTLALVDTFTTPDEGDEAAAVSVGSDGALLMATKKGIVHLRASSGVWARELVDGAAPTPAPHGNNPPATQGTAPPK
jgi:hypothetical protein